MRHTGINPATTQRKLTPAKAPCRGTIRAFYLPFRVAELKKAGLRFRNEIEKRPGGKQMQLEAPTATRWSLFESAR